MEISIKEIIKCFLEEAMVLPLNSIVLQFISLAVEKAVHGINRRIMDFLLFLRLSLYSYI